MRDLLGQVLDLLADGPVALARIVDRSGAGPRDTGAAMVVTPAGRVLGSLAGGCVEAAVLATAEQVLTDGTSCTERFAAADELTVGLPCGGEIEVFVERLDHADLPLLRELRSALDAHQPIAYATTLEATPDRRLLRPGQITPWRDLDQDAAALLTAGRNGSVGAEDCTPAAATRPRTFVQVFRSPARMILAGANDYTRALATAATQLGYRVTVVDARETFTTPALFPAADEVVVDWPHRYLAAEAAADRVDDRTVVCVLTHDPKFDVPMLTAALALPTIGFIGALGSRRAHTDRVARLREQNLSPASISRIHSPLGLDLGAHTPAETAVSILAEILAARTDASARPLSTLTGPIHAEPSTRPPRE
ncbi:XdhC family protein [Nocardia caishijiensis]|uniref:Xanthine dehydrogenase accessory factor n=1 Tax=Nocardia caishijiensis TaxID=184756 RepID=A0ABQ6YK35_9NOCA|nr:XdhC/CoxI family protein [Nocardia caishijiensis]KAF0846147.1 xanthine dehydrogenase accessory factor [Nocardia caishijiensis]